MIKNILAVAIVVALSAGNNTDNGTGGGAGDGTGGAGDEFVEDTTIPTGGGEGPAAGTAAGTYVGFLGENDGVFIINNDNEIAGLNFLADGSALSFFGSLGAGDSFQGGLRLYEHQESVTLGDTDLGDSFGAVASLVNESFQIDISIVAGQTIDSQSEELAAVQLTPPTDGELTPATAAALAGDWTAVHTFCGGGNCQPLTTNLTFSGVQVTGNTVVTSLDGDDIETGTLNGGITEFGDASIVEFNWNGAVYSGLVFFSPENEGKIVFLGESLASEGGETPTISALLTRQ